MKTKSPITGRLLRNPGESVDRKLESVISDGITFYLLFATVFVILALLEWVRWWTETPPSPAIPTIVAMVVVAVTYLQIKRIKKRADALRLGRDGEKAVGQCLERLRERGAKVLHDIPGEGFNIDHVVIDNSGVYIIETKTLSKPEKGEPKLVFDGVTVRRNGIEPGRNPVTQVKAAQAWLTGILQESTGKKAPSRAVVLYPGWFVEKIKDGQPSDVWVLNPKAFLQFIENGRPRMTNEDVNLFAYHLSTYIRNAAENS